MSLATIIHGIPAEVKPIKGLPSGTRYRLQLRARDVAHVYVKTADGIAKHLVRLDGKDWILGPCVGVNRRNVAP